MLGRSGRTFSRRTVAAAAWTSAWLRGELGAVGQGDRHQVVERPAGVDQGDLEVVVLQRDDHRAGVEPEDLGEVGAVDAPLLPRRGGLLLEVGDHVPGPIDLDRWGPGPGSSARSARPGRAPARRSRGRRHTFPGTGAPGSRRRRSCSRASFLAVWMSHCRALRTCRATRGWKMASVMATFCDQAGTAVEEVHARRGHDALVEVRAAAVVPDDNRSRC